MFPLHTLDRVIDAWIYGMDPLTFLRLGEHLEAFRQRYRDDPTLFERLIREQVLANPHRLSICLRPDPEMQEQTDAAFTERMSALRDTFSDADTEQIAEQAAALQRSNSQPNSPDAVARLPQLAVGDLPDEITHIDTSVGDVDGVDLLRNDVFANGVNYLALSFDLVGLPAELWPFMPRYTSALRKLGAAGQDYAAIARRTAATTGGIGASTGIGCHAEDPDRPVWRLTMRLKALDHQIEPALELLRDLLFEVDPGDRDRLREVMVQTRSRCRTQLVHQGLGTAQTYAARGMSEGGYLHDLMGGLPQLDQSEEVAGAFDEHADALIERIESIRDFLLNRERLAVSFTGSDAAFDLASAALSAWITSMPSAPVVPAPTGFEPLPPSHAGLAGPIQVAHCAKVLPAPPATDPAEAPLRVGAHLIRMDYLLPEVRFKGNAYGASFSYDPRASRAAFGSYRDPHVARTLGVFDATDRYVAEAEWSQLDIDRAIIATAKGDFRPIRPTRRPAQRCSDTWAAPRRSCSSGATSRCAASPAGGEGSARRPAGAVRAGVGLRGFQPPETGAGQPGAGAAAGRTRHPAPWRRRPPVTRSRGVATSRWARSNAARSSPRPGRDAIRCSPTSAAGRCSTSWSCRRSSASSCSAICPPTTWSSLSRTSTCWTACGAATGSV